MKRNKAILSIFLILIIILVAGASIYISSKVSQERPIAPTAPESLPKAAEKSECKAREACLDAVPHPCKLPEPAEGWCPGASECVTCGTSGCVSGLTCDPVDGLCKKTDSTSPTVCWSGSTACTVSAISLCVASGVKTCNPDCSILCGTAATTISTCTDSCGVATTKSCPAIAACGVDGGWGEVGACSATACGTTGTKTRTCNNPAPSNGGAECTRADGSLTTPSVRTEVTACSAAVCGVDGGWGEVGACSATACGTTGTKTRTCNNPAPSNGGAECTRADGSLTTPSVRTEVTACSAAACGCTPSGVISCDPGCPTTCGLGSSTISTCTDSCEGSATKLCPATAACAGATAAPTVAPTAVAAEPTVLPETGILDFPGVAAFGGGLLLAIIGILLAL